MNKNVKNIEVTSGMKGVDLNLSSLETKGGDYLDENKRNAQRTRLVEITAGLMGVSKDDVYKVLRGRHENEQVFACFMTLMEKETQMIESVKDLLPFDL